MTFRDYLETRGINNNTQGSESIVYAAIASTRPDITYREASLIFADVPVIRDTFEALWYGYESELDRQNYERSGPVDVYTITGRVLDDIRQRAAVNDKL